MKKLTPALILVLAANGVLAGESVTDFRSLAVLAATAEAVAGIQRGDYPFFLRSQAGKRFERSLDSANHEVVSRMNARLGKKLVTSSPVVEVPLQQVNLIY